MAEKTNVYGLDRKTVEQQIATKALQCRDESLRGAIYRARASAKNLANVARSASHPLERSKREAALEVFRERRVDCSIAAAALGLRMKMLNAMAEHFVETGVVGSKESGLTYARMLADHESDLSYEKWRHGGWYVHGVQYPSGAIGCVSNNYPDRKWRIVCDSRRTDLGAEDDHTYPTRVMAARAEQELAKAEWMEFALNKPQAEEAVAERPRG